jgi:hypothetical protein
MSTHSNGMPVRQLEDQLGLTYRTAWLLTQKLRRSMVDLDREPLERVVEVDQAEIPFRVGDTFFDTGNAGKILIAGAIEVIDRDTNEAQPRQKGAKYLNRSGRIRLAMIADKFCSLDRSLREGQCEAWIDGLDLHAMSGDYRGSGSASYHLRMLLGILVYGYARGYSRPGQSRRLSRRRARLPSTRAR